MRGITAEAWRAGFNVVRLNQRNCSGTEHETPHLYHSGLSEDLYAVATALCLRDGIDAIWLAGYSMGGNLVLRLAGEMGAAFPALKGVAAVCPTIDPAACAAALEHPRNRIYQRFFLSSLFARLQRKARLFPGRFDLSKLASTCTLRAFDEHYTAPDAGYAGAADYYERTGARHVLQQITVPTLILTSQDDPLVPYHSFSVSAIAGNPQIRLIAPTYGGHCGFIQRPRPDEDFFWAENRLVEFLSDGAA
jgi:predicted alpha/beta-fold hydrolase